MLVEFGGIGRPIGVYQSRKSAGRTVGHPGPGCAAGSVCGLDGSRVNLSGNHNGATLFTDQPGSVRLVSPNPCCSCPGQPRFGIISPRLLRRDASVLPCGPGHPGRCVCFVRRPELSRFSSCVPICPPFRCTSGARAGRKGFRAPLQPWTASRSGCSRRP